MVEQEDSMRVQIAKCENSIYWYCNNIGDQFLVKDTGNDIDYEIMDNGEYTGRWITRTDCIILNDDDHMPPHLREAEDEYIKISDDRRDKILSELDKVEGIINEVPGGSLTEVQLLIAEECDKIKEELIAKNRKYGNSAIKPCRVFSKASPIEQLNVRLDDKLSRLMSGQADEDEDVDFDLMGYIVLRRVAKTIHKEGNK